jgi:hypothetical protein
MDRSLNFLRYLFFARGVRVEFAGDVCMLRHK